MRDSLSSLTLNCQPEFDKKPYLETMPGGVRCFRKKVDVIYKGSQQAESRRASVVFSPSIFTGKEHLGTGGRKEETGGRHEGAGHWPCWHSYCALERVLRPRWQSKGRTQVASDGPRWERPSRSRKTI